MTRNIAAGLLIGALILSQFSTLRAQALPTGINEWASVRAVPPGDELAVKLKDGKKIKGRVQGVSEDHLTLTRKKQVTSVSRQEISQVERVVPKSAAKPALIGAATGAAIVAAGVGTAVAASGDGGDAGEAAVVTLGLSLIGAGAGAIVGLGFGIRQKKVLIYVSK